MRGSLAMVCVVLLCSCQKPHDPGIDSLLGTWKVDYPATLLEAQKDPKLSPEDLRRLPELIERLVKSLRVEITKKELIYHRGTKRIAQGYEMGKSEGKSIGLRIRDAKPAVTLRFTLREDGRMLLRSSASDDMKHYVWQKSE